ncbi:MAG: alpha/beta hydrolase [Hamadaea sp.]|nr:alpha/beta hydrolase [Hamadaea sp.]NUT07249.1 alpha/beta hydrolase [Hamadaea sp.]
MTLPIVLLHGIRLSRTMWEPVVIRLGPTAYAPDLPGHGRRRGEPFTLEAATETAADAIDAAGGRALVAGLSLGGYTAIATAERYPEKVAGLVAMGCTARNRAMIRLYRAAAAVAGRFPRRADAVSAYAIRRALPHDVAESVLSGGVGCAVLPSAVAAITAHDQLAALRAYAGPVWLVNGDRDPFRADEREFLAACRDGRRVRLPHTGHVTTLADPDRLAALLAEARHHAEAVTADTGGKQTGPTLSS